MTYDLWLEIQQFLIKEAWLLDDRRFEEWLDLFTEDVLYWAPVRYSVSRDDLDKEFSQLGDVPLFEENKDTLKARVGRFDSKMAWAEDPPSRTRHAITNVVVEPAGNDGELKVRSAFQIYRTRLEHDRDWFVGSREDILRKVDGDWKIARRTIYLDETIIPAKNLSIFF